MKVVLGVSWAIFALRSSGSEKDTQVTSSAMTVAGTLAIAVAVGVSGKQMDGGGANVTEEAEEVQVPEHESSEEVEGCVCSSKGAGWGQKVNEAFCAAQASKPRPSGRCGPDLDWEAS